MKCYFCAQDIKGDVEYHHPDKREYPDWVESSHKECHRRYHSENGHFKEWGANGGILAPFRGYQGYVLAVAKWPGFHRMGGLARARTASRDDLGRFV